MIHLLLALCFSSEIFSHPLELNLELSLGRQEWATRSREHAFHEPQLPRGGFKGGSEILRPCNYHHGSSGRSGTLLLSTNGVPLSKDLSSELASPALTTFDEPSKVLAENGAPLVDGNGNPAKMGFCGWEFVDHVCESLGASLGRRFQSGGEGSRQDSSQPCKKAKWDAAAQMSVASSESDFACVDRRTKNLLSPIWHLPEKGLYHPLLLYSHPQTSSLASGHELREHPSRSRVTLDSFSIPIENKECTTQAHEASLTDNKPTLAHHFSQWSQADLSDQHESVRRDSVFPGADMLISNSDSVRIPMGAPQQAGSATVQISVSIGSESPIGKTPGIDQTPSEVPFSQGDVAQMREMDPRIFGWISGGIAKSSAGIIYNDLLGDVAQKLKIQLEKSLLVGLREESLLKGVIPNRNSVNILDLEMAQREEIMERNAQRKLVSKLWMAFEQVLSLNEMILATFGTDLGNQSHKPQQKRICDWLHDKLFPSELSLQDRSNIESSQLKKLSSHFMLFLGVQKKTNVALILQRQKNDYRTVGKKLELLTKLAVDILGSYYKYSNSEKWRGLYPCDRDFVKLLAVLRVRRFNGNMGKLKNYQKDLMQDLSLIPWEKEIQIHKLMMLKELNPLKEYYEKPDSYWLKYMKTQPEGNTMHMV